MRLRSLIIWICAFAGAVPALGVTDEFLGVSSAGEAPAALAGAAAAGEWSRAGWLAMVFTGDEDAAEGYFKRALAADAEDAATLEGAAWLDFSRGRMPRAYERWQQYLELYPDGEAAVALISTLRFFDGIVPAYAQTPDFLLALARRPDCPAATRDAAGRVAESLLLQYGRWDDAKAWARERGYLMDFSVCGVYNEYGLADVDHAFGPEKAFTASPEVTAGEDGWRPVDSRFGAINVGGALGFNMGVAYATTTFDLPAGEFWLEIQGDDWFRAYLGGVEVMTNHPADGPARTLYRCRFKTNGGRQRLLIKTLQNNDPVYSTDGAWIFKARVLKADGATPANVTADAADMAAAGAPAVPLDTEDGDDGDGPMADFYAGFDDFTVGSYLAGIDKVNAATSAAPACALFYVAGAYGRILSGGEYNLAGAKSQLRRARAEDPACVVAIEELAVFASYEGKREEAVDYYRESLREEPAYVSSVCGLVDIASREGWEAELNRQAKSALALNPGAYRALLALAGYYYDKDNTDRAAEYYEKYTEYKANDAGVRALLAEVYLFRGDMEAAERQYRTVLEFEPYNEDAYLGLADLAARRGNEDAAREWFAKGAAMLPRSSELRRQGGYYLCGLGLRDEGFAALREALALDAGDYRTRLYLEREGAIEPDAVSRALTVDGAELAKRDVGPEDYPQADTAMLLDQTVVYVNPDYSFRETNHNLIKIMNDAGRERWGEITVMSGRGTEIIDARTHLPDGEVVDAVSIKDTSGYKAISMERVVPGAVLEVAYDLNIDRRMIFNLLQYYSQPFYMAELGEALLWTRYAVVVPDDSPAKDRLTFDVANQRLKPKKIRGEGRTAYLFERRDMPPIVEEPMMPSKDAYAPYVRVTTFEDVDTVGEWYRGELFGKFRFDEFLEKRLRTVELPKDEAGRAAAVYYHVVSSIESSGGSVYYPSSARVTAFRGRGRTVDRAVLIVALCRRLGIDAKLALVGTGGSKGEWDVVTPEIFDTVLVYFPTVGSEGTFADPLLDTFSFGDVWTTAYGKPALIVDDQGYEMGRVPAAPFEKDSIGLELELELDYGGAAKFAGRRIYRGLRGAYRESFTNPEEQESNVEISLSQIFAAATIDGYSFDNLFDLKGEFALNFEGRVPNFARTRGDNLAVRVVPYEFTLAQVFITAEKRNYPLRIERPEAWIDDVRVKIPAGYEIDYMPDSGRIRGPGSEYVLELGAEGDELTIKRHLFIDQGDISPGDYKKFVKFCREVDRIEKTEIILAPAPLP
ncbi:MAG: transglutaminase domain-containing protein [Candidatus Zixiibacteriota bacterium]|jgi:Tfp pilus assembly protein PilF